MTGLVPKLKTEVAAYKRRRILEEASNLFWDQGYERATLDAVAERLHVTKPFIYSYYRNKSELLFEICQTGIQLSLRALQEALETDANPENRLKSLIESVARIVIENQEYIVVYLREQKNLRPENAATIMTMRKDFDHRLAELLLEGRRAGVFEFPDASVAATSISGMVTWLASWYAPGKRLSAEEVVAQTTQLVVKMVASRVPE